MGHRLDERLAYQHAKRHCSPPKWRRWGMRVHFSSPIARQKKSARRIGVETDRVVLTMIRGSVILSVAKLEKKVFRNAVSGGLFLLRSISVFVCSLRLAEILIQLVEILRQVVTECSRIRSFRLEGDGVFRPISHHLCRQAAV